MLGDQENINHGKRESKMKFFIVGILNGRSNGNKIIFFEVKVEQIAMTDQMRVALAVEELVSIFVSRWFWRWKHSRTSKRCLELGDEVIFDCGLKEQAAPIRCAVSIRMTSEKPKTLEVLDRLREPSHRLVKHRLQAIFANFYFRKNHFHWNPTSYCLQAVSVNSWNTWTTRASCCQRTTTF